MNLTLTTEQAQELMQLADAAVRAHGLQLARQAVRCMDLLDAAAAEAAQPAPEDPQ
jgi:hypothetical protein